MPTLLVVDDEQDNVELMTRRLTRRGFTVCGSNAALEGIALAKSLRPDVILMDIKMPEVDGYEAIARLKADPETAAIPIIALTAHAMQEDRDRASAAGAEEYECKPVDLNRLLEKIQRFVDASPPRS